MELWSEGVYESRFEEHFVRRFTSILLSLMVGQLTYAAESAPLSGKALFDTVRHYADFGEHRTGTPADIATSDWLANQLGQAGYAVEKQPFTLRQYFPGQQSLGFAGSSFSVFPHWFPNSGSTPIVGRIRSLHHAELKGHIAYLSPESAGAWYKVRPSQLARQWTPGILSKWFLYSARTTCNPYRGSGKFGVTSFASV